MYSIKNLFVYCFLSFGSLFIINGAINYNFNSDLNVITSHNYSEFSIHNSSEVNELYFEKEISSFEVHNFTDYDNVINVNIKQKPINPSIVDSIDKFEYNKFSIDFNKLDFSQYSKRKEEFIKTVLPLILYENQKILLERKKLQELKNLLITKNTLDNVDLKYLAKIAKNYKIKSKNKHKLDLVNELLISVDIIPNSIVLSQAANESGWGTSRFAKEYNALFGEYTYNFSEGVIPLKRDKDAKHLVKSFSSIDKSIQSYFNNINTHHAYQDFREVRQIMRNKNNFSKIDILVSRLDTYAADEKYIDTIKSIIKSNNLKKFDFSIYTFVSL